MAAFLNTEIYSYTYAGTIPAVQQVVGLTALLKNLIGLVKDVAQSIFTCSSFTKINERHFESQKKIVNQIDALKLLKQAKETELNALLSPLVQIGDDKINEAIELIKQQQSDLKLQPLDPAVQRIFTAYNVGTLKGQYESLSRTLDKQLENAIKDLEWDITVLEIMKCQLGLERLHNIAIAILTFIPVIGTIYNGISLHYFPEEVTA